MFYHSNIVKPENRAKICLLLFSPLTTTWLLVIFWWISHSRPKTVFVFWKMKIWFFISPIDSARWAASIGERTFIFTTYHKHIYFVFFEKIFDIAFLPFFLPFWRFSTFFCFFDIVWRFSTFLTFFCIFWHFLTFFNLFDIFQRFWHFLIFFNFFDIYHRKKAESPEGSAFFRYRNSGDFR